MKVVIKGKQGEGKSRLAHMICACVNYAGMTYEFSEPDGLMFTNATAAIKRVDVIIKTKQVDK